MSATPLVAPRSDDHRHIVLVTGAAGAIGSATVGVFIEAGFHVVGLDRAESVASVATDHYTGYQVDLEDEATVEDTLATAESLGRLAHVIGIAGGALPGEPSLINEPFTMTTERFRASIEANLVTQFVAARASLPWLRRSGGGDRSMTFTSSFNGLTGCGMPAYSAAKAGLIGLMLAVTGPLGAEGIRVNVVAPGTVRTPRTERIWSGVPGHFERLETTTALGRLGAPDDVARVFLSLATLLNHVTGQVLVVDGGQMVKRG